MAGVDRKPAYDDVKDAWTYRLQHDNHGRGVVLIDMTLGLGSLIHDVRAETAAYLRGAP